MEYFTLPHANKPIVGTIFSITISPENGTLFVPEMVYLMQTGHKHGLVLLYFYENE